MCCWTRADTAQGCVDPQVPPAHSLGGARSPTFCFLRRITFTPSTETMRLTFFFLMFFALNSYYEEGEGRETGVSRDGKSWGETPTPLLLTGSSSQRQVYEPVFLSGPALAAPPRCAQRVQLARRQSRGSLGFHSK